ncbi:MAG TPA: hypothetical protein VN893_21385 [Bryobacteraceae bacterium]|nr:hypothetical protein [Bryobacteraceae bacterium]
MPTHVILDINGYFAPLNGALAATFRALSRVLAMRLKARAET